MGAREKKRGRDRQKKQTGRMAGFYPSILSKTVKIKGGCSRVKKKGGVEEGNKGVAEGVH